MPSSGSVAERSRRRSCGVICAAAARRSVLASRPSRNTRSCSCFILDGCADHRTGGCPLSSPLVTRRVLLLAGTTEAAALARELAGRPDLDVVASLAGRTRSPAAFPCQVLVGGFGGVGGLIDALGTFDVLVDATHPFAATMSWIAAEAAATAGVPRLRVLRPPWTPSPGDDWHEVADLAAAADALLTLGSTRAFLALGSQHLTSFASLNGVGLVVRAIEAPDPMPIVGATLVLARGPFDVASERALLDEHDIDTVVLRNSGGTATRAKLDAARQLGLRLVVVARPPAPEGPIVDSIHGAVTWIERANRGAAVP